MPDPVTETTEAAEQAPDPLDPSLLPYLDYPLYFRDDGGPFCHVAGCRHYDCSDGWGDGSLHSSRRMTVREFLADVRAHAEYAKTVAGKEGSPS